MRLDPCRPCYKDKELAKKISKLPGMNKPVMKLPQQPPVPVQRIPVPSAPRLPAPRPLR